MISIGKTNFICNACGAIFLKWAGRCDACLSWNTIHEEEKRNHCPLPDSFQLISLNDPFLEQCQRLTTGFSEFDRVCGGGLIPGAIILVGGDPGIGKSTLLLQVSATLSQTVPVIYISGEEGAQQIRMRAQRFKLGNVPMQLACSTRLENVIACLNQKPTPQLAVIDSIQTLSSDEVGSMPGTINQMRAVTGSLIRLAKDNHITIILVSHVTKEGMIAGPRVIEHMVDTVLYFEGERGHPFRILRAVKNRFGPTNEVGVFDMMEHGLEAVKNPSALFLSHRNDSVPGVCVFGGLEGTRPLLVEIQALVANSFLASPRRAVVGWDQNRLAMILAILETRCGLAYSGKDVYLNVVGGLRIQDPAADLAVAAALISCLKNIPFPSHFIAFGEIGLSGEVRPVNQPEARLREGVQMGFSHAIIPPYPRDKKIPSYNLKLMTISHIRDWVDISENEGYKTNATEKYAAPKDGITL